MRIVEQAGDAAIADWLEDLLGPVLEAGRAAICVPGGSTPFPILAELAGRSLDWQRLSVWPGDDRMVAPDHPASNIGRIRASLGRTGAQCVALDAGARPPHFTLTWLGMGEDGHIASLFPSSEPLAGDPLPLRRIVPDPLPPEAPFARLSLTIPALTDCDALLFVIRGESKRRLFEQAARGENDLPIARLLKAAHCPVTCFT